MVQRHTVVIPTADGSGAEVYPLKEWGRQHPDMFPDGFDFVYGTSHSYRKALLQRQGWTKQESEAEYRLIAPGAEGSIGIVEDLLGEAEPVERGYDAPYFSLEYQLRDFLASNLSTIDFGGKRLCLYVDPTGRDGVEYPTAVGPIDLLAVDNEGSFYVFELKRGNSSDRAIGQIARYMGWVKQTIGRDKEVQGIIVAKNVGENLKYARSVLPSVTLFEYEVSFSLRLANNVEAVRS
ncbi:endonuclease NucS domain-containing protein [Mesorhizobium huakuii]|uniref:DUF91 domain-containing protein n=1 Tax=Mesorhizobium huakuii TaxID=28104 RepID=A0A7G6T025_9HYPH|nr:endonuclease NucS domain-containing protein [Mesorhizobium huakuii]QND60107.1 DUF91 domain-containing protein [Mesorhizobium huakuii]